MDSLILLALCSLGSIVSAQFNGGFPGAGGPQPLPLPGFEGGPRAVNPFLGPQPIQSRQMGMNNQQRGNDNDRRNGNDHRDQNQNNRNNDRNMDRNNNHNQQQGQQSRSGPDSMLDQMGLGGIAPFYQSLTNELSKTPTGMGMGGGQGQMPNY